jgi:8-oxo-dGTP pyrophosphatase MutT (NUDIX family)
VTHSVLIQTVRRAFEQPLPGSRAQALLAPRPRREWPPDLAAASARAAAGLLMLFPVADETHLVLTERSSRVRHAGQLSLPGGVVEAGESFAEAALREAEEEIALSRDGAEILGALTPIDIPVSGFRLHPIVAAFEHRPVMRPSDHEVARILELPVHRLLSSQGFDERTMLRGNLEVAAPGFAVEGAFIWGATAMVLAELLVMLGWVGPVKQ